MPGQSFCQEEGTMLELTGLRLPYTATEEELKQYAENAKVAAAKAAEAKAAEANNKDLTKTEKK